MNYLKPFNTANPKILENLYNKNDEDMIEDLFYEYFYPTEDFPDSQAQMAKSINESQPRRYSLALNLLNGKGPFIRKVFYENRENESGEYSYRSVLHKLPDGIDKFVEELKLTDSIKSRQNRRKSGWLNGEQLTFPLNNLSDINNIFDQNSDIGKIFRYLDEFYNIKRQLSDILLKTSGLLHYGFVQTPTHQTTETGQKKCMQIELYLNIFVSFQEADGHYTNPSISCTVMVWNFYKPWLN